MAYEPGVVLGGRWRITAPLSAGAMGAIWRATDDRSGREVAVKVVLDQYLNRSDLVQRFEREVRAVADLQHPHVVDYLGQGTDEDGRPYLVTEFLDGYPGIKLVSRDPPLSGAEIVSVISQICSALAISHTRGIVHRDLKWSNVMITPQPGEPLFVKLIDFGILKYSDVAAPGDKKKLTRAGVLLGTPEYTSPEQILGRPLDGRSDLYAIGIMTYELVVGQRPFVAANKADLLVKHMKEAPAPLTEANMRTPVPPAFRAAVMRALEKNPDDRFASVAYFSRALDAAVRSAEAEPPKPKPEPKGDKGGGEASGGGGIWSWLRPKKDS